MKVKRISTSLHWHRRRGRTEDLRWKILSVLPYAHTIVFENKCTLNPFFSFMWKQQQIQQSMSEQREVKSNVTFVVYISPLSSNREENTGCVVSLLSSRDNSGMIGHVGKQEISSDSQMLLRTCSTKYVRNVNTFIEY